jgi:hypothetical protein
MDYCSDLGSEGEFYQAQVCPFGGTLTPAVEAWIADHVWALEETLTS